MSDQKCTSCGGGHRFPLARPLRRSTVTDAHTIGYLLECGCVIMTPPWTVRITRSVLTTMSFIVRQDREIVWRVAITSPDGVTSVGTYSECEWAAQPEPV